MVYLLPVHSKQMKPEQLIGLKYRLGSNPETHGTADCLSLARAVLAYQGIETPEPKRDWYRRLRRGDTDVFQEELERWGTLVDEPRIGSVGLCVTDEDKGRGLASYWSEGWISFVGSEVVWSPIGGLPVVGVYCQQKQRSATRSG